MDHDDVSDRAAAAFRAALHQSAESDEYDRPGPDPSSIRRRLTRHRKVGAAVATAMVLIVAILVVPGLGLRTASDPVAAGPTSPVVPADWRLEQYRFVSFRVPDSWGYGTAPGSDWCSTGPDGTPSPRPQSSFVQLGSLPVRDIGCPVLPSRLFVEHVAVAPATEPDPGGPSESESDGWWTVERVLTRVDTYVRVTVVSRDLSLARQVSASAQVGGGPCDWTSEVGRVGSRAGTADLNAFLLADEVLICQYDPVTEADGGGMRAARRLTGAAARTLAEEVRTNLIEGRSAASRCGGLKQPMLELAATLRVTGTAQVYVATGTCIDPADANTAFGGVDGGGDTVRVLTSDLCRRIVQPPLRIDSWSRGLDPCSH